MKSVEYNTKHAHFTNVKQKVKNIVINIISKFVTSVVLSITLKMAIIKLGDDGNIDD